MPTMPNNPRNGTQPLPSLKGRGGVGSGFFRLHTLVQSIILGLLISTLAACSSASSQPGGLDPLGTAAVTEAQAKAARQQMERIVKVTQEAQAASASATETVRQNEQAATRTAQEMAQQAQTARLASEIRATDQAVAAQATAQQIQVVRAAQAVQATQTAMAVEAAAAAYNHRLVSEANATATAITQQQRAEVQQLEVEQTRQRNETIWQVLLLGVGAILGTVVVVFVILSVRPAVVKMWEASMKSRENMARIRAATQHPVQIVNEPRAPWPAANITPTTPSANSRPVSMQPMGRSPYRGRFGNEDILAKWDAKGARESHREGDLESTDSMVIEED